MKVTDFTNYAISDLIRFQNWVTCAPFSEMDIDRDSWYEALDLFLIGEYESCDTV